MFESETFRKQIYYLAITAVQPEIREDIFKNEFLLPVPKRKSDRDRLIKLARSVRKYQERARYEFRKASMAAESLFTGYNKKADTI